MRSITPLFALLLAACTQKFEPQEGDLLFQADRRSEFSQAIASSTGTPQQLVYTHVALVADTPEGLQVIEASSKEGVVIRPLETFLDESPQSGGQPLVTVARLKDRRPVKAAVERARRLAGRPYDFAFEQGDDALYCSELIWTCFRDEEGTPLFSSQPMSFRDDEGNLPPYWLDHYRKLGRAIPEGEPGTNPNDLLRESALICVYNYFNQ